MATLNSTVKKTSEFDKKNLLSNLFTMSARLILKVSALGTLGLGSFYAGSYLERKNVISSLQSSLDIDGVLLEALVSKEKSVSKPGLPVFATVSAATPILPGDLVKSGPGRVSQIMKFGFPSLDNIRSMDNFVLSYDRRNRVANWVFEHLTKDMVKHNSEVDRSKCDFHVDESVHPYFRSENTDYKGSGFDRGHMAAAGNHRLSQKHVDQTFLLSNMAPQVGVGFNRHKWNQLEKHVRKLTSKYSNVYCCTGPLYLPRREGDGKTYVKYQVLGANSVAVPTHFFKVVVADDSRGGLHMEAYCLPNQAIPDDTPLTQFQVNPDIIERAAGLLFFDKVQRTQLLTINGKKG